ncbi:pilus assembly protein TadG-related protein [Dermacoccaceae bacterium W4C1]
MTWRVSPRRGLARLGCRSREESADSGRISILIAGFLGLLMLLILGAVDVTATQLARARMLDAADSAAADAADSISEGSVYSQGVGGELVLDDAGVRRSANRSLARQQQPANVTGWNIGPGTGSPDGRTAVVVLNGRVDPPISGPLLSFIGEVDITVTSRARADVGAG